jgi:hypothetical protein
VTRGRRTLLLSAVVAVAVVVVALVVRQVTAEDRTRLQQAVDLAPAGAQRLSWTDWAGVRDELGTDNLDQLIDEGFDADLTSTSALVTSAASLEESFGFSPQNLEWELFAQGTDAAVVLMGLADGDAGTVADRLRDLGYEEPDDDTGVWLGGSDLLAGIGDLTPELQFIALDDERDLAVASDTEEGALSAVEQLDDDGGPDVEEVTAAVGPALSAAVYTGDQACNALAMAGADPADQAAGEERIAQAGEIDPLTGFAIAERRGGDLRVAMSFETEAQARDNADSRAALASGPAYGQGGDFADRFELGDVVADGDVVTMELGPVEGAYVLSDLSSGPVLFATC